MAAAAGAKWASAERSLSCVCVRPPGGEPRMRGPNPLTALIAIVISVTAAGSIMRRAANASLIHGGDRSQMTGNK